MAVDPVDPTNARTRSRLATVMATVYDATNIKAVIEAKRGSLLSTVIKGGVYLICGGLPFGSRGGREICPARLGRQAKTLSSEPRQGWAWRGYENNMSTTIAARPNVAAAEFSYIEMMFPETLEP